MKQLILDIIARINTVQGVNFVAVWNNQLSDIESGDVYSFPFPAVFIDIQDYNINDIGNGVQVYEDLIINIHIVTEFYNNSVYEAQEQNLDIFDLKQDIFKALYLFEPNNAVAFTRLGEQQDKDYTNLYHFIQSYKTNLLDNSGKIYGKYSTTITEWQGQFHR